MNIFYNNYGKTAKEVVTKGGDPIKLWKIAVERNFTSESAKIKGCPKNTFLGLCEAGFVKGIPKGNYTKSVKNKEYALQAIEILKRSDNKKFAPKELWSELNLGDKRHNSQMDVVLALWNEGLIVK